MPRRLLLLALPPLLACSAGDSGAPADCPDVSTAYACPDGMTVTSETTRTLPDATVIPHGPATIVTGDLEGTGVLQIYVGTGNTVTRLDGDGWATATTMWTQGDGRGVYPLIADLTGDSVPDLGIGLPGSDHGAGQVIVFAGPITGALTWDSPHGEFKGTNGLGRDLSTIDLNNDGVLDLVAVDDEDIWVKFGPLLSDDPFDAGSDAVWTSVAGDFDLLGIEDLDGDGAADLVLERTVWGPDTGCAPDDTRALVEDGSGVFVVPGRLDAGRYSLGEASLTLAFPPELWVAQALYGDIDGDGAFDILAIGFDAATPDAMFPEAALYTGPIAAGAEPAARFGVAGRLGGIGDLDGDGVADLLQADWLGLAGGAVPAGEAVLGGPVDELPAYDADGCGYRVAALWTGPTSQWATTASWFGDLNGDGVGDAILGTDGDDGDGLVQVVLGGG